MTLYESFLGLYFPARLILVRFTAKLKTGGPLRIFTGIGLSNFKGGVHS
jgi:hypothetical protein